MMTKKEAVFVLRCWERVYSCSKRAGITDDKLDGPKYAISALKEVIEG